jgi:hypothetical protein
VKLHDFFGRVIPTTSSPPPPLNRGAQQIIGSLVQKAKEAEQTGHVGPVFQAPVYGRDMFPPRMLPDDRCDLDFSDGEIASEEQAMHDDNLADQRRYQQSDFLFDEPSEDDEPEQEGNSEEEEM